MSDRKPTVNASWMSRQESLKRYMDRLSKMDPNDIAGLLRRAKVKGHLSHSETCAMARYLTKRIGTPCGVGATVTWIEGTFVPVPLPGNVKEFIDRFDAGGYPFLRLSKGKSK